MINIRLLIARWCSKKSRWQNDCCR